MIYCTDFISLLILIMAIQWKSFSWSCTLHKFACAWISCALWSCQSFAYSKQSRFYIDLLIITINSRLTNVCQRPRPTLRLGLDRWDIDRADIEIDASFARSGNFGTVNKVWGVEIKNMGVRLRGIAITICVHLSLNLRESGGAGRRWRSRHWRARKAWPI